MQSVENFLRMFRVEYFIGELCRSGLSGNMFPHVQVDAYHLRWHFRHILFEQLIDKPVYLVGVVTCPDKKVFHDMFHTLFPADRFPRQFGAVNQQQDGLCRRFDGRNGNIISLPSSVTCA